MKDPWSDDELIIYATNSRRYGLHRSHTVNVPGGPSIVIPGHFTTDLSSVPRMLWWWAPPHGPYTPAAVLHDWLYASGIYSKRQADKWFHQHMLACGVRPTMARTKYIAVRLFGRRAWNKHRNRERG